MGADEELILRASKCKMSEWEKDKLRDYVVKIRSASRRSSAWGILHDISQIIFFWSLVILAISTSAQYTEKYSPTVADYIEKMNETMTIMDEPMSILMPISFPIMIILGTVRAGALGKLNKWLMNCTSLVVLVELRAAKNTTRLSSSDGDSYATTSMPTYGPG